MRFGDAAAMLAGSGLGALGPTVWADLGCGTGTFTRALAEVVAPGSTIHAVDVDADALSHVPSRYRDVTIHTVAGDFTKAPWRFGHLDGILMANSLHYIRDQAAFIAQCVSQLTPVWHFVIVEYDMARANRWVPYPVSRSTLGEVFRTAGHGSITLLGSRPSLYHRAPLYAALVSSHRPPSDRPI